MMSPLSQQCQLKTYLCSFEDSFRLRIEVKISPECLLKHSLAQTKLLSVHSSKVADTAETVHRIAISAQDSGQLSFPLVELERREGLT